MLHFRRIAEATTLALLCVVAACNRGGDPQQTAQQGGGGGSPAGGGRGRRPSGPVPVEVAEVALGSIARSVTVSGVVEPIRTIAVNSQLAGELLSVDVQEGDRVVEGAPLARLDDREIQAQLTAAEASLQVAQAAFDRSEQLRDRKVITLPEYEQTRTAYAAAQAQVDQLKTRVGYAAVKAPLAGVVVEKNVEAGDAVGNQTKLFTLADISTLVVRLGVSELDVVDLSVSEPVKVTLDALPNRNFDGHIRRIFPSADPSTRLVTVEVALAPGSENTVKPGFLARVTFALARRNNVMLVPSGAIVGSGSGSTQAVFVVRDGHATLRTVEPGLISEGRVEVLSGLSVGDSVVSLGTNGLRDGGEVRVMNGSEAAVAEAAAAGEGR
jgi:membrane fusion protein, multidrug efflux system